MDSKDYERMRSAAKSMAKIKASFITAMSHDGPAGRNTYYRASAADKTSRMSTVARGETKSLRTLVRASNYL